MRCRWRRWTSPRRFCTRVGTQGRTPLQYVFSHFAYPGWTGDIHCVHLDCCNEQLVLIQRCVRHFVVSVGRPAMCCRFLCFSVLQYILWSLFLYVTSVRPSLLTAYSNGAPIPRPGSAHSKTPSLHSLQLTPHPRPRPHPHPSSPPILIFQCTAPRVDQTRR